MPPPPLDVTVGTDHATWATDARLRALVEHAPDPVVVLDALGAIVILSDENGRVIYANRIGRSLFGLADGDEPRGELAGFLVPESMERCRREIMPALDQRGTWTGELTFRARTGATIPVAATLQLHRDEGDELVFVSTIAHDISELKTTQELLEHQATHDPLTGLPNRTLFQELGEQALARANRDGTTIAVLFLDLDRFKPVNDTLGHVAGDELLAQLAARLRAAVRAGDVVARFGGDEFVILCEHAAGAPELLELAARLVEVSSAPARVSGTDVATGASIGIAIGGGSRVTIDALLRDADAALLLAKEVGGGRAKLFGTPVG